MNKEFKLEFSNRVVEHLGIKLYQNKPSNVIAEFVSNCWDADATIVDIDLKGGTGESAAIVVSDNGLGMTRDQITDEFLIIGRNRRATPTVRTPAGRPPMGRKGIGKLAGFGIAKTLDVISIPHKKLIDPDDASPLEVFWLRFSLDDILNGVDAIGGMSYPPKVICDGKSIEDFCEIAEKENLSGIFNQFIDRAKSGVGGVCIYLSDITLKKTINIDVLLKSMGRRFTVTMLRNDFVVQVNGRSITPEYALPPLHALDIFGDWKTPLTANVDVLGESKPIKYWVKFVSLKEADWSLEEAGIGVYAHGKIVQDRPFFFDIKGKEIHSRYVYGVIEADWLDELPDDIVSTDRRSIDWDADATKSLHEWGAKNLSIWIEEFRKWHSKDSKRSVVEKIREVAPDSRLSSVEEDALADLLSDIFLEFGGNEEAKNHAAKNFTDAWTHEPIRKLTQELWQRIFSNSGCDSESFAGLMKNLVDSMVPEAMSLAVTIAQRIAPITAMYKIVLGEKTETHLQKLIEGFPWLLGPSWERLTANQAIRTLVRDKFVPDANKGHWSMDDPSLNLRPDFVFLGDVTDSKQIIVFELKGPESEKTLQLGEYDQLSEYLKIIRRAYPNPDIEIKGILIGHDLGGFYEYDRGIETKRWSDVLLAARARNLEHLNALVKVANPRANDVRLKQIADFGGAEVIELLKRMQVIAGEDPLYDQLIYDATEGQLLPEIPDKTISNLVSILEDSSQDSKVIAPSLIQLPPTQDK